MFEELDLLSYEDLVSVCHGIFAHWNEEPDISYRLEDNLSKIAISFAEKYSSSKEKDLLSSYINERTIHTLPLEAKKAGDDFLQKLSVLY